MGSKTNIEWTDATWNPTVGCTRVSKGCDNCYAFSLHDMRHEAWKAGNFPTAPLQYHQSFSTVQLIPNRLDLPLRWGEPRRIFVDSMADLFHPDVPDSYLYDVFAVMAMANRHTFQVLTKRPRRMKAFLNAEETPILIAHRANRMAETKRYGLDVSDHADANLFPYENIWLGTSVEDQDAAFRIDYLRHTPAAIRFLSCEPLVGPLHLGGSLYPQRDPFDPSLVLRESIDWVIVGGESGKGHRPIDPAWVRSLKDECLLANTAFFFKQWGGQTPKANGRMLDGAEWSQFPDAR